MGDTNRQPATIRFDAYEVDLQSGGLAGSPAISAAAVFGPDDAWAFGALPDGRPYDLRYDGRRWAGVTLPAVLSGGPDALAPLSRDDMWAIATTPTTVGEPAARQAHVLLHWDGVSWQPAALPDLRLPAGESGVPSGVAAGGSRDVWVTGYVVAKTAPVGAFLLRWDGTSWHRVGLPGPGLAPGAVAQDGAGGLWLSASLPGGAASLYHYDGRRWTSQQVAAKKGYLTRLRALSLIPGTRSLWASGSLEPASPGAGHQAVILKYGS